MSLLINESSLISITRECFFNLYYVDEIGVIICRMITIFLNNTDLLNRYINNNHLYREKSRNKFCFFVYFLLAIFSCKFEKNYYSMINKTELYRYEYTSKFYFYFIFIDNLIFCANSKRTCYIDSMIQELYHIVINNNIYIDKSQETNFISLYIFYAKSKRIIIQ